MNKQKIKQIEYYKTIKSKKKEILKNMNLIIQSSSDKKIDLLIHNIIVNLWIIRDRCKALKLIENLDDYELILNYGFKEDD